MTFKPTYSITTDIINSISSIEVVRQHIVNLPVTAKVIASLRETARLTSTHHSTAIEGNNLTAAEVREVIQEGAHFPHREKDEREVQNYYKALDYVEKISQDKSPLEEKNLKMLHGIAFEGKDTPTPYRDGQNVIRKGKLVVYIPPKASDVPSLMKDSVRWIVNSINEGLPVPIVAGIAHYQFATIHPYYDGNGRTARLLVTLILQKYGYGLKGIYSLEEYYAQNLEAYYAALTVGSDEDYYDGQREKADLTKFLEYFIKGMAEAFLKVREQAQASQKRGETDQSVLLRDLSYQQKSALKLFFSSKEITTKEIAKLFKISDRQARYICQKWVEEKFIRVSNAAAKTRTYRLCDPYENLIVEQMT